MKTYVAIVMLALLGFTLVGFLAQKPHDHETHHHDAFPADLIERNNLGVGQMGMFRYRDAVETFTSIVEDYPDVHDVRINLAIATLNRQDDGDEAAALGIVEGVLAEDAEHLRAHYVAGLLRSYAGEQDVAAEHFMFVAERDPDDPFAQYYAGQCLMSSGQIEDAYERLRRAIDLDPYLRSAYYAASRAAIRLDMEEESTALGELFQRLEPNPRAQLVEFKYTKMGPKGSATTLGDHDHHDDHEHHAPDGPLFAPPRPLLTNATDAPWRATATEARPNVTVCDLDHDGDIDVFIAGALDSVETPNAVCINRGDDTFMLDLNHPLARTTDVNAVLWGDIQNDGLTDVYFCRHGANQLFVQSEDGLWRDRTSVFGVANDVYNTVDGAIVDADHDGDLDIFCVNADGPNELLNNNLDGSFRPIARDQSIDGGNRASRQVLFADLDADRDLDIIVLNEEPPHDIMLNDRLWSYTAAVDFGDVPITPMHALAVADLDADGRVELHGHNGERRLVWSYGDEGWHQPDREQAEETGPSPVGLVPLDLDGTGEMLVHPVAAGETFVVIDGVSGPSRITIGEDGVPVIEDPGEGRYAFLAMTLSGREDAGQSMRSNASGIGAMIEVRVGSRWVTTTSLRQGSPAGQSLQPIAVGLHGRPQADFVAIDWSDGVFQSEIELAADTRHDIVETQRQLSSCPVVFTWNGESFEFVSDVLGVGGIGYAIGRGTYATPRPWERFMLPAGVLEPKDGRYVIKLSEPMEEACYLDRVALIAYDLPPGVIMTLDERMHINGPEPTGEPVTGRRWIEPVAVVNDRGIDVTPEVREVDGMAAPLPALDHRFLGRLEGEHILEVRFDEPIGGDEDVRLVIDGWVEYAYSQTMFAAWQADASYDAITVEAMGADGSWLTVLDRFGYPAGMPRQMSVPLMEIPSTTRLRLRTNQEIYIDRLALLPVVADDRIRRLDLRPVVARLRQTGFPKRLEHPQRRPEYVYAERAPFWDTRYQAGRYTETGDCLELVERADNAVAVFGAGEEIHLEFEVPNTPVPDGWSRTFVLDLNGWCKDMDMFTRTGETIEPMPTVGTVARRVEDLHSRYNTRYEAGRASVHAASSNE